MKTDRPTLVKPGELRIARASGSLATLGLGSCVAVALYDAEARIGGLTHSILPHPMKGRPPGPPGRFASIAIPLLVEMLVHEGADAARLQAWLAGGASMFAGLLSENGRSMGDRNIEASRAALAEASIQVLGEDVGGTYGRSVYFDLAQGRVTVRSVQHATKVL